VAYWQGEYGRAAALFEETLAFARQLGDRQHCALSQIYLGHCASRRGDATTAATRYQEALRLCRAIGDRFLLAYALEGWGWATRGQGGDERAVWLYGTAETLRAATGAALPAHDLSDRDEKVGVLREALGEARFEAVLAAGRALPLEEALAMALEGHAAVAEGE
jgi:hypothetical protein